MRNRPYLTSFQQLEIIAMSELVTAFGLLGQQFAASNNPNNAAHLAAINDHLTKLDDEENTDSADIKDTRDALQAFLSAAQGNPVGTPAQTPGPTPQPTVAPTA